MLFATRDRVFSALIVGLVAAGCAADLFLSTSNLEIGPNPAQPGETVIASFRLALAPTQSHTIIIFIDDVEHSRVTTSEPPAVPMVLEIGEAGDLIDSYGEGVHSAYVEVRLTDRNRTSRTRSVTFELQAATP